MDWPPTLEKIGKQNFSSILKISHTMTCYRGLYTQENLCIGFKKSLDGADADDWSNKDLGC